MAYTNKSDYIRPAYSGGGKAFNTHGARFDNGMVFVNEGGSHEENPNGGVQVGADENGKPNLVEQGEVIVDVGGGPYVMSQRLKLSRDELLMAGLPVRYAGKTFAEAATGMQKESEERPLDGISQRGLKSYLERLAAIQETQRDAIGASGTQNLNLGQDLYSARAGAVGHEEEMGQEPMEPGYGEMQGYSAYGGPVKNYNDMPYYYQPVYYDGLTDHPPVQIGRPYLQAAPQQGGMVYAQLPYPASYPYPTVARQMAYGGYRFSGSASMGIGDVTDLGNGEKLIDLGNGNFMYKKADGTPEVINNGQAEALINNIDKLAGPRNPSKDMLIGNKAPDTGNTPYTATETAVETDKGKNDYTGNERKYKEANVGVKQNRLASNNQNADNNTLNLAYTPIYDPVTGNLVGYSDPLADYNGIFVNDMPTGTNNTQSVSGNNVTVTPWPGNAYGGYFRR